MVSMKILYCDGWSGPSLLKGYITYQSILDLTLLSLGDSTLFISYHISEWGSRYPVYLFSGGHIQPLGISQLPIEGSTSTLSSPSAYVFETLSVPDSIHIAMIEKTQTGYYLTLTFDKFIVKRQIRLYKYFK